jgi:hypothetical protein
MPRFVILTHDHPHLHWDLMLESGGILRTWRLAEELTGTPPHGGITVEALPDHRIEYLTYEGPVSGNRGIVSQWDAGTYQTVSETEASMCLDLSGQRIRGRYWFMTS